MGVLDGIVGENGDVRGAAADVHQRDAQLALFFRQHGLGRCQGFQRDVRDFQFAAVAGAHDVLGRGHGPGHDVHLDLQTHSRHAQRIGDAALVVHDIFLRQDVDDFTVRRDGHGTGRIERAFHIALAHFAALDGDDAMAVDPGDMPAGDPHIDRIDLTAGHELGVLDGAPDGLHGLLNIHHHALAHAVRGTGADPNDIHQAVFRHFPYDRTHFGSADIQAYNEIRHSYSSPNIIRAWAD